MAKSLESLAREVKLQRALLDISAAEQYEGENLTYGELARTLGLNTEGDKCDTVDFVNACLHVGDNATVQAMPDAERIRVISSATGAIEELLTNRGRNLIQ